MKLRGKIAGAALVVAIVASFVSVAGLAYGETTEPTITDLAWYWEDAQSSSQTTPVGDVTVETPNPFCASRVQGGVGDPTGGASCAEDAMPAWARNGDYETPYMLSAAAFDVTLVPIGSTVKQFTVTFLEDESGCVDDDEKPETAPKCRQTDQINAENQRLQACLVTQLIGSGEARQYKELPNHECTDSDPIAVRKEIKNDDKADPTDTDPDHVWKFDLTSYAQGWVEDFSVVTGIVVKPMKAAKEEDEQDEWRVVLSGPRVPNGVVTKLVYEPGEDTGFEDFDDPTDTDTDITGPTTVGGSGPSFSPPTSGAPGAPVAPGDPAAPTDPNAEGEELAAEEAADVQSMPGYVWLAILGGLIAFSLVRSVVVESAAGPRADGVVAQIRKLNAQEVGVAATETSAGGIGATLAGIGGAVAHGASSVVGKIKSLVRRG